MYKDGPQYNKHVKAKHDYSVTHNHKYTPVIINWPVKGGPRWRTKMSLVLIITYMLRMMYISEQFSNDIFIMKLYIMYMMYVFINESHETICNDLYTCNEHDETLHTYGTIHVHVPRLRLAGILYLFYFSSHFASHQRFWWAKQPAILTRVTLATFDKFD